MQALNKRIKQYSYRKVKHIQTQILNNNETNTMKTTQAYRQNN